MIATLKEAGVHPIIANHPLVQLLEKLRNQWANVDIFYESGRDDVALKLVTLSLCHTYLFGRFTLPSYAAHIFFTLRELPPTDDELGKILLSNSSVFSGELFTSNVSGKSGDHHAHYFDMIEAYERAGGDKDVINRFRQADVKGNFAQAILNSSIWSKTMISYAHFLQNATKDKITAFLIAVASEETIQEGYKTILKHLNAHERYSKYKSFLEKHIELDTQAHGPATIQWINWYIDNVKPTKAEVDKAMRKTVQFLKKRIATYAIPRTFAWSHFNFILMR